MKELSEWQAERRRGTESIKKEVGAWGLSVASAGGTAPWFGNEFSGTFRRPLCTFSGHPSKPNLAPISPLSAEATLYTFSLQAILLNL